MSRPALTGAERSRDRDLLARIARGDVAALRCVYDAHAGRVLAVALRILKDQAEAEDVVQETFLELWRRSAQYDQARGGAIAWIVTIARSRAIDRLRSSGSAARALEAASAAPASAEPEPLPGDLAELNRERSRIVAALETLPQEQREAIELAYYEGLSQREIAERTTSPLGTVKMRVRLALSKLAGLLKGEE